MGLMFWPCRSLTLALKLDHRRGLVAGDASEQSFYFEFKSPVGSYTSFPPGVIVAKPVCVRKVLGSVDYILLILHIPAPLLFSVQSVFSVAM